MGGVNEQSGWAALAVPIPFKVKFVANSRIDDCYKEN